MRAGFRTNPLFGDTVWGPDLSIACRETGEGCGAHKSEGVDDSDSGLPTCPKRCGAAIVPMNGERGKKF